ncbi:UNKNOWN [Stylonychia lemnae]|uniref:Uncharacterized protein n=1 Tax=Stylonychia lemnae TaxID=5949 RepID=A0A078AI44_STYLE|nr:UNKNOWN [Stylonychia lemnae]|eukprot:CDW81925.1 UNKNOWN [Stylonychia lemnae]
MVQQYLQQHGENHEEALKSELAQKFEDYLKMNSTDKLNLGKIQNVFEYMVREKHSQEDIQKSFIMLLAKEQYFEANFFLKGIVQSVIDQSSIPEQVQFFNFMEKTNLIWQFSHIYFDNILKQTESKYQDYFKLDRDDAFKNYTTNQKIIDYRSPNIKTKLIWIRDRQKKMLDKMLMRNITDFSNEQLIDLLQGYSKQQQGSPIKTKLILEKLSHDYQITDIDKALQLASTLLLLPNHSKKLGENVYTQLKMDLFDYINKNFKDIIHVDQFVTLNNIILNPEYYKQFDKKDRILPQEVTTILVNEFESKLHDVNKIDYLNMIINVVKYNHQDLSAQWRNDMKAMIIGVNNSSLLLSHTYHHEYDNKTLEKAIIQSIKLRFDEEFTQVLENSTSNMNYLILLSGLKGLVESKKDYNHLDPNLILSILDINLRQPKSEDNLILVSREFGKDIVKHMDSNMFNYQQLDIIQKAAKRYSILFPEPLELYNKCIRISLEKLLKKV